jgi:hypothetical protein
VDDYGKYIKQVEDGNPDCISYQIETGLNGDKETHTWEEIKEDIILREGI